MGGEKKDGKPTNSVEKFCSKEGRWMDVVPMVVPRVSASSVVFNNQIIVSGGAIRNESTDSNEPTDSIEVLNLDQFPLKWVIFAGKLPLPLSGHQTFVYKGKLIVVGSYDKTEYYPISEVVHSPPCKTIVQLILHKRQIYC